MPNGYRIPKFKYRIVVSLPRISGCVVNDGSVVLDRTKASGWTTMRILREYQRAYPHCDVRVERKGTNHD